MQGFGINVPLLVTLTYGYGGVALAASPACWRHRSTR